MAKTDFEETEKATRWTNPWPTRCAKHHRSKKKNSDDVELMPLPMETRFLGQILWNLRRKWFWRSGEVTLSSGKCFDRLVIPPTLHVYDLVGLPLLDLTVTAMEAAHFSRFNSEFCVP